MYVGRIVMVGRTPEGKNVAAYRVSSRSFPNREARLNAEAQTVSIMPKPGFEGDLAKNPYIAYNCIRMAKDWAIVTNGSQTDPIAEKMLLGMNVRDAIALSLLAMDYEKDHLNTPRIVAAVPLKGDIGYLGIVRHDAISVMPITLEAGKFSYVTTYEHNIPGQFNSDGYTVKTAQEACDFIFAQGLFVNLEKPVTAAAALADATTFALAVK